MSPVTKKLFWHIFIQWLASQNKLETWLELTNTLTYVNAYDDLVLCNVEVNEFVIQGIGEAEAINWTNVTINWGDFVIEHAQFIEQVPVEEMHENPNP